jgi:hypothetical protein
MATEIPPGIAIPAEVQSRLGKLTFVDGFPEKDTARVLFDNLDFQRAVQAYLLALPPVNQVANRKGMAQWGPPNVTVPIFEELMTPDSLFLTANQNTPYTWAWLDLRDGPLVVEVPPKVLGAIDDMWYHWVVDVGMTGPDKGAGGKYLLLPPGYDGAVPEGYFVVRPPTFSNWIPWRSFLTDGDPKPGVDLVKKFTRIYQLSEDGNPPDLTFVNVSHQPFSTLAPADYEFWEYLNAVVQEEPTDSVDPLTLGFYAAIGIQKGKPFAPDERMRAILTEAAVVGDATVRTISFRMRQPEAYYYYPESRCWRLPYIGGYRFESEGVYNIDAAAYFFFLATGVTPAMEQKIVGQGSQYAWACTDSDDEALDGARNYRLHLPPDVPINNFWSVIVYDNQTRSMLQTDQRWPAFSSQNPDVNANQDGSIDVFFGPEPPAGKEANWIQTIPGKGWNTLLRLYGALDPWFDKTWRPGDIEVQ